VKVTDYFPIVRNALIKWGDQTMALPLGVDGSVLSEPADRVPKSVALTALAARKAVSNERIGVWFDTETLKPRIAEPAFAEALQQLTAAPGGDSSSRPGPTSPVPLLGYNDRLIAVTQSTHNAASAFRFITWLAQPETSTQLARVGNAQLPARLSVASSAAWYDPALGATDRADRGNALARLLSAEQFILLPRIPGIDDYLSVLDEAVGSTTDALSAFKALERAVEKWEKITDSRGRDAQRQAYLKSLNITD
jgi:ABC-type glycerol-3-phosphate transport system substrate-binding protein